MNRKVCLSIFCRIPKNSPTPFPTYLLSLSAFLFILRWSLTTLRRATSRMASHSAKRFTQVNLKDPHAHPLVSSDVPPESGNPSPSRNTQDSSNTHNDTAAKSKRNRTYPDQEGDGRTANSSDRTHPISKRPGIKQDTGKVQSSPPSGLHPSSQPAPANETSRKDGATGNLNGKVSFEVKEESPWRSYDEGYDLRVSGLVTVAKKKRSGITAKGRPASKVVAVRKLSGSGRNTSLSILLRVQGEYFVRCTDTYEFGAELYVVLEHMLISLVQVVAAPVHPKETHVSAIVGQVRFQPITLTPALTSPGAERYRVS